MRLRLSRGAADRQEKSAQIVKSAAAAGLAGARIVKSRGRRTPFRVAPPRLRSVIASGILGVRAGRAAATTTMDYHRFDTPGIALSERFDYWRTWYSQAVDVPMRLEPVDTLPRNFQASAEVLGDGEADVVELHCGPALGSWQREATEAADRLRLVILAPTPAAVGHWHGQDVSLEKGAVALLGNTDGSWRAPAGLHGIQVNVPRAAVAMTDSEIARIDTQRVQRDPVFASLVRPVLLGMAGRLRELSHADMAELPAVWPSMIAMLVRSLAGRDTNGAEPALARRVQVRRFIRAHLADPGLSPDAIARALNVSRRTLYASFPAAGDGIAAEIRRQRLQRAQAMLLDPAVTRPIAEIAAAVGLPSPAHFSRLFRVEYGHSPREARAHRRQDARRPPDTTQPAIG